MSLNPSLQPEIGPDGLPREAPVIAYNVKIIEDEQLQLKKYIEENYSKIRDVERELANLTMEMKLTAGPKNAETSTERIRAAKLKEEQAWKAWEAATEAVRDEEAMKQKLCKDLNQLVQESSNSHFSRLEELKRRLESLNPGRASTASPHDAKPTGPALKSTVLDASSVPNTVAGRIMENVPNQVNVGNMQAVNGCVEPPCLEGEERSGKKKVHFHVRGKGIVTVPKGKGYATPGWTGGCV